MAKKSEKTEDEKKTIIFKGKTHLRNTYTVKIQVADGKIDTIQIMGRPNLFVEETCRSFEMKHPKNVEDVLSVIKLEMIKRSEYAGEERFA